MGFEWAHVISDEKHCGTFVCTICQNLVGLDAVVTTTCSHVFCRVCLETWLTKTASSSITARCQCPTCNQDLLYQHSSSSASSGKTTTMMGDVAVNVVALSEAQPLAFRVLRQVQVRCPLSKVACPWKGDYGDLHAHLLSPTEHEGLAPTSATTTTGPTATHSSSENATLSRPEVALSEAIRPLEGASPAISTSAPNNDGEDDEDMNVEDVTPEPEQGMEEDDMHAALQRQSQLAESFKAEADAMFASTNYREARDLYTKALSVLQLERKTPLVEEPHDQEGLHLGLLTKLWSNRAATQMHLKEYEKAVEDCTRCLELDPSHTKALYRRSKALVELGKFEEAYASLLLPIEEASPKSHRLKNSTLQKQAAHVSALRNDWNRAWEEYHDGKYAAAKSVFGNLLRETSAHQVLLATAQCDVAMGLTDSALRLSLQVLRAQPRDATAYRVRGHCLLLMADFDAASSLLREALRLDPDNDDTTGTRNTTEKNRTSAKTLWKQCRMLQSTVKKARDAVFYRRFAEAVELFSTVLRPSTEDYDSETPQLALPSKSLLYVVIHTERAEAYVRLKQWDKALQDASRAVYAREDYIPAWLVKARAYHGLERFAQARDDMEDLLRKGWGSGSSEAANIRKAYESADFEVRKRQRPDYYQLLDLSSLASLMEIKKQYKVKALEYHPDRWSGPQFSDAQRKEAETKFKLLGEALEMLSNEFSRQLYDEGYDPEAIRERVAAAQQAAHQSQGRGHYHH